MDPDDSIFFKMTYRIPVKRILKELQLLKNGIAEGITITPREERADVIDITITGPEGSPYEGGLFKLVAYIPEQYPFEPPCLKFSTPVYHPNVDSGGNICLDILKDKWRPCVRLEVLCISIRLLLSNPNPDDPLIPEIAEQYLLEKDQFNLTARKHTKENAMGAVRVEKRGLDSDEIVCKKRKQ